MKLFLAWQDQASRQWFPIGRLSTADDGMYEFVYVRGFERARDQAGLTPLPAFPDTERVYLSPNLFPMFNNRIMSPSREEYPRYLERMNLTAEEPPMSILARSLGQRSTDSFELFPFPLDPSSKRFEIDFFVHGIRHRPLEAQAKSLELSPGDPLGLRHDLDNYDDPAAVLVLASDETPIGFVPRYYAPDLVVLLESEVEIACAVQHVNRQSDRIRQRLLCRLRAPWPMDEPPFERPEYRPIPNTERLAS